MSRIRSCSLAIALLGGSLWVLGLVAQDKPKTPANIQDRAEASKTGDVAEGIQATADEFVKAYNAHDAKALSNLFLPEALVYDEEFKSFEGREKIQEAFAANFKENPKIQIALDVLSVDTIGKTMAVEIGMSETIAAPGAAPERSRYVVLHVERDGHWKMALVRDMPDESTSHEHLLPLAWMVGDWIDESREARVATSCRWDASRNFLLQEITVHRAGKETMQISQRIGWDPLTKHIKAWVFDSEGGYGESLWTRTESGWLIKASGVRPDGAMASATNSIETDGFDAYGFRSVDRIVNHEIEPDIEVRVVRRPPEPSVKK